jgi:hypothetical protein
MSYDPPNYGPPTKEEIGGTVIWLATMAVAGAGLVLALSLIGAVLSWIF